MHFKMHPFDPPSERPLSPAAALAAWIEETGYNQKNAALELQWADSELSTVLTNRKKISDRMARDMARVLDQLPAYKGWTAQHWLDVQKNFLRWTKTPKGAAAMWQERTERVGVLCDIDICELAEADVLKINPFDKSRVQPASYDLAAGTLSWFGRRDRNNDARRVELADVQTTILAPGETVLVLAREHFEIPNFISARVAPVGSLVELGILFSFGIQMDPGWKGQPFFTLSHHGDEPIDIDADSICASIEFQFLQRVPKRPFGQQRPDNFAGRETRNLPLPQSHYSALPPAKSRA